MRKNNIGVAGYLELNGEGFNTVHDTGRLYLQKQEKMQYCSMAMQWRKINMESTGEVHYNSYRRGRIVKLAGDVTYQTGKREHRLF